MRFGNRLELKHHLETVHEGTLSGVVLGEAAFMSRPFYTCPWCVGDASKIKYPLSSIKYSLMVHVKERAANDHDHKIAYKATNSIHAVQMDSRASSSRMDLEPVNLSPIMMMGYLFAKCAIQDGQQPH